MLVLGVSDEADKAIRGVVNVKVCKGSCKWFYDSDASLKSVKSVKVKLKTQSKATEKVQFLGTSKIFTETSDQVKRGQYEL